ncbi:hypothetical protein Q9323_15055 [Pseudomonas fulva]|uniref:hypothetical protein n=1 Tax=Pseudomonas fulva TaxID=47880 RepID=UPI0031F708AC
MTTKNIFALGVETSLTDHEWIEGCALAMLADGDDMGYQTHLFRLNNRYDGDGADLDLMAFFNDGLPEGHQLNPNYNMIEH